MAQKKHHVISNAYDAYWFLHDHPKLQRRLRTEVKPEEADELEKKGFLITRDRGGKCYREFRHGTVPAIDENLSIFYTKTNKPGGHGRVDSKNRKSNKYVECWLEFGTVEYGYMSHDSTTKQPYDWDTETYEQSFHDYRVDTGGSTFDQALINLARKVRKVYGDYGLTARGDKCGRPICGDCIGMKKWRKKQGL